MEGSLHDYRRLLPVGAEIQPEGGVHFRVWAPHRKTIEIVFSSNPGTAEPPREPAPLASEGNGYFSAFVKEAAEGTSYRFRLDGSEHLYPDPASRYQPGGPFGPSSVVDPGGYRWEDTDWSGVEMRGQVVYEMHIGTFTAEGTWGAAAGELQELKNLGITVIEVMPVCDFPGRFGWGYDGVDLFAPTRLYGRPDDFRRFVDRAHSLGLAVILDVVYNHLGPSGNFLAQFAREYFSEAYFTEWGQAMNFDGPESDPVREFFIANAGYWIEEFHLDGLRLDATQQIFDSSSDHILAQIQRKVRQAGGKRRTILVAENEPQQVRLLSPPEEGGFGMDAVWNDDFHHSAMVALTGHNEAYYTDYRAHPQEFVSMAKYGFLFQGQRYRWQNKRRGTPTYGMPRWAFINFLQNHDQIANSGQGLRCHCLSSPGRTKALTALLLLGPGTPMLFQGQEFAASSPFFYFADQDEEVATLVHRGRTEFLHQFRSLAVPEIQARLPDPGDPATFVRCKLDFIDRQRHAHIYALHRDLLRLRREDPVFRHAAEVRLDGAVLGGETFVLRFFGKDDDRLLVVNLGLDLHLDPAPEPLLAPPDGKMWKLLWSTEDPHYQGNGTAPLDTEDNWIIPGHAAVALCPEPKEDVHA